MKGCLLVSGCPPTTHFRKGAPQCSLSSLHLIGESFGIWNVVQFFHSNLFSFYKIKTRMIYNCNAIGIFITFFHIHQLPSWIENKACGSISCYYHLSVVSSQRKETTLNRGESNAETMTVGQEGEKEWWVLLSLCWSPKSPLNFSCWEL